MKTLIERLREHNKLGIGMMLVISSLLSIGLLLARMGYTSSIGFRFMTWNLFLAWIPLFLSTTIVLTHEKIRPRWLLVILVATWLLFFPNAPYILTDLFHLKARAGVPLWFDLLMILSFAWTGLMVGFMSLVDIQDLIAKKWSKTAGWVCTVAALLLASFGIYLGRFEKWNSWDILSHPALLIGDVFERVLHPLSHPRTIGMTLSYAAFLLVGYLTLKQLIKMPSCTHQRAPAE